MRDRLCDRASPDIRSQLRTCGRRAEQPDHRRRDRRAVARRGNVGNSNRKGGAFAGCDDIDSPHISADSDSDSDTGADSGPDADSDGYTDTDAESDPCSKP
jgi:hypothetical protein